MFSYVQTEMQVAKLYIVQFINGKQLTTAHIYWEIVFFLQIWGPLISAIISIRNTDDWWEKRKIYRSGCIRKVKGELIAVAIRLWLYMLITRSLSMNACVRLGKDFVEVESLKKLSLWKGKTIALVHWRTMAHRKKKKNKKRKRQRQRFQEHFGLLKMERSISNNLYSDVQCAPLGRTQSIASLTVPLVPSPLQTSS